MALKFSLDLEGATFDELATFVESLKTAGMKDHDTLTLDGTQLVATVEPTGGQVSDARRATATPRQTVYPDAFPSTGNLDFMKFGDAALDSLIEALKYRRGR
ncbi:hypothetical protein [uncultured Corynebacterium sp.]|jgi:hypothetical protein|uniref:hypothetical protein n=1 Tax=uncultured Corynebacterium sp. TaxID=159447 RepID=UPI0028D8EDA1|nr:hypothetical protein [uncultured Corynebacterium sp.]